MIEITEKRLDELMKAEHFIHCLEAAGVDNWGGFEYALEMYAEYYDD